MQATFFVPARVHPYDPIHASRSRDDLKSRWVPTLVVLVACAPAGIARAAPLRHLQDDAAVFSARERASIERQLVSAERRLGSPLFVEITSHLHGESAVEVGERLLAARAAGDDAGSNPVLLLLALKDRVGAIATGKGNAGIVPELDAARITKKLLANQKSQGWRVALGSAIDAVIESAEATAERRRPLPPEPGEETPLPAEVETAVPVASRSTVDAHAGEDGATDLVDAKAATGPDAGAMTATGKPNTPGGASPPSHSRLPLAIGAGVLFLVALGLRRRKQLAASRAGPGQNPPPPRPRIPPSTSGHDPRLGPRGPRSPRR